MNTSLSGEFPKNQLTYISLIPVEMTDTNTRLYEGLFPDLEIKDLGYSPGFIPRLDLVNQSRSTFLNRVATERGLSAGEEIADKIRYFEETPFVVEKAQTRRLQSQKNPDNYFNLVDVKANGETFKQLKQTAGDLFKIATYDGVKPPASAKNVPRVFSLLWTKKPGSADQYVEYLNDTMPTIQLSPPKMFDKNRNEIN